MHADAWLRLDPRSEAARTLTGEKARRMLAPFLAAARGLSEAARAAGVSRQAMRYWVRKFERLGLLVRLRGPGRPRWQSAAPAYLIPFSASRATDLEEWLAERAATDHAALLRAAARHLEAQGIDHLHFTSDPRNGGPLTRPADALGRVALERDLVDGFAGVLELSPADASALRRDLAALWERYRVRHGRGVRLRVYAHLVEEKSDAGDASAVAS
ncbi:hypothetical protein [Oceanithermus desulfurans]